MRNRKDARTWVDGSGREKRGGQPLVQTKKSILDEESLSRAIQAAYGLPPAIDVSLYRISGSDVYRVTDQDRSWFLKVYRSRERDRKRALTGVGVLDLLSRQGFPVPRPAPTRDGDLVMALRAVEGGRLAYLAEAVQGEEPLESDARHGYLFGQTAARLHELMDEVASPDQFRVIDYRYLFERYLRGVEQLLGHEKSSIRFLRNLARALWSELNDLLPQTSPQVGFCHGDLHTGNARLTAAGQIFLFDFDACGFGWRAMDIGTYYASYDWMGLDEESRQKRQRTLSNFLEGYNAVRQITEAERRSLELFMAIRHFELLGIGIGRLPYQGTHWLNGKRLQADLAWFREWLQGCEVLAEPYGRKLSVL